MQFISGLCGWVQSVVNKYTKNNKIQESAVNFEIYKKKGMPYVTASFSGNKKGVLVHP